MSKIGRQAARKSVVSLHLSVMRHLVTHRMIWLPMLFPDRRGTRWRRRRWVLVERVERRTLHIWILRVRIISLLKGMMILVNVLPDVSKIIGIRQQLTGLPSDASEQVILVVGIRRWHGVAIAMTVLGGIHPFAFWGSGKRTPRSSI